MGTDVIFGVLGVALTLLSIGVTVILFILRGVNNALATLSQDVKQTNASLSSFKESVAKEYYTKPEIDARFDAQAEASRLQQDSTLKAINTRLDQLELHAGTTNTVMNDLTRILPKMLAKMEP